MLTPFIFYERRQKVLGCVFRRLVKKFVPATTVTSKKRLRVKYATYVSDNKTKLDQGQVWNKPDSFEVDTKNAHHSCSVSWQLLFRALCFPQWSFQFMFVEFLPSQNKPQRKSVNFFPAYSSTFAWAWQMNPLWAKVTVRYSMHRLVISANVHWKAQLLSSVRCTDGGN